MNDRKPSARAVRVISTSRGYVCDHYGGKFAHLVGTILKTSKVDVNDLTISRARNPMDSWSVVGMKNTELFSLLLHHQLECSRRLAVLLSNQRVFSLKSMKVKTIEVMLESDDGCQESNKIIDPFWCLRKCIEEIFFSSPKTSSCSYRQPHTCRDRRGSWEKLEDVALH